jgi:hypothetical protein
MINERDRHIRLAAGGGIAVFALHNSCLPGARFPVAVVVADEILQPV